MGICLSAVFLTTAEMGCSIPLRRGQGRAFNAKESLFIELHPLDISSHFFMARSPLFLSTLLKGAVRSGRGKMKQMLFPCQFPSGGSPVEMPGTPCCFLHQQMAGGSIPCVCFPFSKLQVTSGPASAWSEQMGVHILYRWLT